MKFTAFFFDLDETLYPENPALMGELRKRLSEYCLKTVPMDPADVAEFREGLYKKHGGTLPGLAVEYGADLCDGLEYCHRFDVDKLITPDPVLAEVLARCDVHKYILTNSYRFYATRVLRRLGILDCFDGIIDTLDIFPHEKPDPLSFARALEMTNEKDASTCAFFDDQGRNVDAAHEAGLFSVQVGHFQPAQNADARIELASDLLTIPQFKELLK